MAKLEIACFNVDSAVIAQQNGADRIELCENIELGGTTPNPATVRQLKREITIDLYVMIRQRGGDFAYTMTELMVMHWVIEELKNAGADGFVFGVLTHERKIDVEANKSLIRMAAPLPCTFHRAFDEVSDYEQALEDIISCGFTSVLTSGQAPTVNEGINRLADLVKKSNGRIEIMPGGSLRSTNIEIVRDITKANWYHSSAITDGSETANPSEIQALKSKLQ
nr:copper homeostasis protein CutC [uncultured Flavobacterium sp.]